MRVPISQCGFAPVCDITKTVKVAKRAQLVIQYNSVDSLKECEEGEYLYLCLKHLRIAPDHRPAPDADTPNVW